MADADVVLNIPLVVHRDRGGSSADRTAVNPIHPREGAVFGERVRISAPFEACVTNWSTDRNRRISSSSARTHSLLS